MIKYAMVITASLALLAAPAWANGRSGWSGSAGGVSGNIFAHSQSGGFSMSGSLGGNGRTSMRNESGAGQFSGAITTFDGNRRGTEMTAETFTEGFDYSQSQSRGGFGMSGASRMGTATAGGSFGGGWGTFRNN